MYKDILLPIDLNHECSWQRALPVALDYCRAFGGKLHVMTVMPDFGMSLVGSYFPEGFESKHREAYDKQLHAFVAANIPAEIKVQHIVVGGIAVQGNSGDSGKNRRRFDCNGVAPARVEGLSAGAECGTGGAPCDAIGIGRTGGV